MRCAARPPIVSDLFRGIESDTSIDQVLDRPDLPLWVQVKCLRPLYRTCGYYGFLPNALKVPVVYNHGEYALYRGGYADVWKGSCSGREVAVKVIRAYSSSESSKITSVSYCSVPSIHPTADDTI